jgi:hypothetical protein
MFDCSVIHSVSYEDKCIFGLCVNVLVIKLQMENTKEKILFIIIRMYVRLHINNKCDYFFK